MRSAILNSEGACILNYLGALLSVLGIVMLIPLIPWWIYDDSALHGISYTVFTLPASACLVLGLVIQKNTSFHAPSLHGAMIITALGWILCAMAGAVPFMTGLHKSFIDAFFESTSGFTTTGITVFEGLDSMPRSILFWRSFTQWLGGLGILTFFLAVSFRGVVQQQPCSLPRATRSTSQGLFQAYSIHSRYSGPSTPCLQWFRF